MAKTVMATTSDMTQYRPSGQALRWWQVAANSAMETSGEGKLDSAYK